MAEEVEERQDLRDRTKQFGLRIIKLYTSLPKGEVSRVIGRQILRSGTSVGANFREAYRARSNAEFIAKLGICLQELDETTYWLELLEDSGIFTATKLADIKNEANQLLAILTTIQKSVRKKTK